MHSCTHGTHTAVLWQPQDPHCLSFHEVHLMCIEQRVTEKSSPLIPMLNAAAAMECIISQHDVTVLKVHAIVEPPLKETPNKGQDSEHQNVTFL